MRGVFRSFCLLLAMSTSACSAPEAAMNAETPTSDSAPSRAELEAKYKRNPAPKQAYRIELKVADAPGPFATVEGFVSYETDCTYTPDKIAGAPIRPSKDLPIEFSKADDSTFFATVYADAMLDEDYFGRGACHWRLLSVNTWVKATGAETDTSYVANLWSDDVAGEKSRKIYYASDEYPGGKLEPRSDYGNTDRNWYRAEYQDKLFNITLTARAGTP